MQFIYPATLTPDPTGGFVVTFRDWPEAITQGDTLDEALLEAADCLEEAVAASIDDRGEIPVNETWDGPRFPQPNALPIARWPKRRTRPLSLVAPLDTESLGNPSGSGNPSGRVEGRCPVRVDPAYLLPPLSFGGASLAEPWSR